MLVAIVSQHLWVVGKDHLSRLCCKPQHTFIMILLVASTSCVWSNTQQQRRLQVCFHGCTPLQQLQT